MFVCNEACNACLCGRAYPSLQQVQFYAEACVLVMRQDKFFTQLKSSSDGFNVIAEFFGRGLLNNTSASAHA